MWDSYQSLKIYHRRPSDDLEVTDSIAAYCVDGAVLWFGLTIENALAETKEVGMGKDKRREQKYTLSQLLDPVFRLPRPQPAPKPSTPTQDGFAAMVALAKQPGSGVKLYQYIKPS